MQRYIDIVRDELGNAIQGAEVRVYIGDSATLATVYDGDDNPVGQPLDTDSAGMIINGAAGLAGLGFRAPGGRYRLNVKKGTDEFDLPDVLIGEVQGYDPVDLFTISGNNIYPDTTTGLAATVDGDFFFVADDTATDLLTLYENNAGAALFHGGILKASDTRDLHDQIAAFGGYFADAATGLAGTSDGEIFSVANDPSAGDITIYKNNLGVANVVLIYYPATSTKVPNTDSAAGDNFIKTNPAGDGWEYQTAAQQRVSLGVPGLSIPNTFTNIQKWAKGADVVSSAILSLGNDGNYFDITGNTAITSIGAKGVGTVVKLHFDSALTLTHHATDLVLPGGANITTAAGDEAEFIEYAAGKWRCTDYNRIKANPQAFETQLFHAQHAATSGSQGGSTSAATVNTRPLNTIVTNEIGASLSSNQITLPPGTYDTDILSCVHEAKRNRVLLYNITDGAYVLQGLSVSDDGANENTSTSRLFGRFVITATKVFEIRHYTEVARAAAGLGIDVSVGLPELWCDAKFWRIG